MNPLDIYSVGLLKPELIKNDEWIGKEASFFYDLRNLHSLWAKVFGIGVRLHAPEVAFAGDPTSLATHDNISWY